MITGTQKIVFAASAAVCAVSVKNYLSIRNTERAKRAKIIADSEREIEVIWAANDRIQKKIQDGYRPSSIAQLHYDINFERIAVHNEQ